jgi:hypothetical protein
MSSHSLLGASGAHRWMECPGSLRETAKITRPQRSSEFALEGTAAHHLASHCLGSGVRPHEYLGYWLHLDQDESVTLRAKLEPAPYAFEVTLEMVEAVDIYLKTVRDHIERLGAGTILRIERRVALDWIGPDLFGTADAVIVGPPGTELVVIDFKYGAGVVVEVPYNPQLMYYALGAWMSEPDPSTFIWIRLGIVQPRAPHPAGPVREWALLPHYLREWSELHLAPAVAATRDPKAPLIPGDHCRFCPARSSCPALRGHLAQAFQYPEFPEETLPARVEPPRPMLPDPADPGQVARALKIAPLAEEWAKAVHGLAQNMLERGIKIPGYKLIRRNSHRRWLDPVTTEAELKDRALHDAFDTRLKSPAQVERIAGKKWVAERVERPEGALGIAPESDHREPVDVKRLEYPELEDIEEN